MPIVSYQMLQWRPLMIVLVLSLAMQTSTCIDASYIIDASKHNQQFNTCAHIEIIKNGNLHFRASILHHVRYIRVCSSFEYLSGAHFQEICYFCDSLFAVSCFVPPECSSRYEGILGHQLSNSA